MKTRLEYLNSPGITRIVVDGHVRTIDLIDFHDDKLSVRLLRRLPDGRQWLTFDADAQVEVPS
jgi:hypothetical protein